MAKKKEQILDFARKYLDSQKFNNTAIEFKEDTKDLYGVGYPVGCKADKATVTIGSNLLECSTEEIKDLLIEIVILLKIKFEKKCDECYSSKHWKALAKKLGHKDLRKVKISKVS
jgi:hypothetical protein